VHGEEEELGVVSEDGCQQPPMETLALKLKTLVTPQTKRRVSHREVGAGKNCARTFGHVHEQGRNSEEQLGMGLE
jgi:hypothetical protein